MLSGLLGIKCIPNFKSNPGLQVRQQAEEKTVKVRDVAGYKISLRLEPRRKCIGRERERKTREEKWNKNAEKKEPSEGSAWWFIYVVKPILHRRPLPSPTTMASNFPCVDKLHGSHCTHCEAITGKRNMQLRGKREMVVCVKEGNRLGRNWMEHNQTGEMGSLKGKIKWPDVECSWGKEAMVPVDKGKKNI